MRYGRASRRRLCRRAFTLIELQIVVVIVGFLFAVMLPALMRVGHPVPQQAPVHTGGRGAVRMPGALPILDAARVDMRLDAAERRVGLDVYSHYVAHCQAHYVVSKPGPVVVRLEIPFPEGTTDARDVWLGMRTAAGLVEPNGVAYSLTGIRWQGVLPGGSAEFEARYTTHGGETFEFHLPRAARTHQADVRVEIQGAPSFVIPDRSLQPTTTAGSTLSWHLTNLVTEYPLVIDLPAADSPLGRASRLFQLAGLALLLFGAGFWYLGDLRRPGALDDFRWGHFLLLALTYCTFFVVFAVLGFHDELPLGWSLAVAAVVALPLLLLHGSRILGWRFALADLLPLAAFTIALAVVGIYGGGWRDYIFLAAAVACTGYVTATFPAWSAGRQAAKERRELATTCRLTTERLEPLVKAAREVTQLAAGALASPDPAGLDWEREHVEADMRELEGLLTASDEIMTNLRAARRPSYPREFAQQVVGERDWQEERYPVAIAALRRSTGSLLARRDRLQTGSPGACHCVVCGQPGGDARYCGACGTPRPQELACTRCDRALVVPAHVALATSQLPLHCPCCGDELPTGQIAA